VKATSIAATVIYIDFIFIIPQPPGF